MITSRAGKNWEAKPQSCNCEDLTKTKRNQGAEILWGTDLGMIVADDNEYR